MSGRFMENLRILDSSWTPCGHHKIINSRWRRDRLVCERRDGWRSLSTQTGKRKTVVRPDERVVRERANPMPRCRRWCRWVVLPWLRIRRAQL
jgi:hypothetical protein